MSLSHGAVSAIFHDQEPQEPILQVIDLKKLGNGKIRTILSDGQHFIMGMFATQLTQLIENDDLRTDSIIVLQTYSLNNMGGKKVMIVLKVGVVQRDSGRIGNPTDVAGGGAPVQQQQQQQPRPPQQFQQQQQQQFQPQQQQQQFPPQQPTSMSSMYGGGAGYAAPKPEPSYGGGGGGYGASHGAVARADPNCSYQPIDSLNPYQNRWVIKARITSKGEMKSWNNARGSGTLFKIELLDDRGGEIAACFFKEAADKFYPLLEVNSVYTFANGRLKVANRQFSSCNNEYEITFGSDADIRQCNEDASIQTVKFNFRKFDVLEHAEPNSTVDVVGVVKRSGDMAELVSKKTGGALFKRDLTLIDESGIEVTLSLWGDKAKEDDAQWQGNPVLAVKKCKVSDYNGVSLSSLGSSQLVLNPPVQETDALLQWWSAMGHSVQAKSLSSGGGGGGGVRDLSLKARKTVGAIKEEGLGMSEKGDFVTVKGVIDYIIRREGQEGPWYVSDPETKYKCVEHSDGSWFCERLDKTIQNPKRRYIMTVSVKDETGSHLVSLFDDQAVELLGHTADEMYQMIVNGEEAKAEAVYKKALFYEGVLSLKIKQESYNDEMRVKVVCNAMQPLDYASESKQLIDAINAY